MDEFKQTQQDRYKELNTQIENLLPGATSAGLSSAYNKMHEKFRKEVFLYGVLFILSLSILFYSVFKFTPEYNPSHTAAVANNEIIQSVLNSKKELNITHEENIDKTIKSTEVVIPTPITVEVSVSNRLVTILDNFIYKFPFILPALWLVLFISKRRKEAQRLAQEYAHKEALAKSYESYKQQIEKLDEEDRNKLLPILMENMLKAIALNPAETLDKNANNETPMEEVIKKKEFWDMIEKLKSFLQNLINSSVK